MKSRSSSRKGNGTVHQAVQMKRAGNTNGQEQAQKLADLRAKFIARTTSTTELETSDEV